MRASHPSRGECKIYSPAHINREKPQLSSLLARREKLELRQAALEDGRLLALEGSEHLGLDGGDKLDLLLGPDLGLDLGKVRELLDDGGARVVLGEAELELARHGVELAVHVKHLGGGLNFIFWSIKITTITTSPPPPTTTNLGGAREHERDGLLGLDLGLERLDLVQAALVQRVGDGLIGDGSIAIEREKSQMKLLPGPACLHLAALVERGGNVLAKVLDERGGDGANREDDDGLGVEDQNLLREEVRGDTARQQGKARVAGLGVQALDGLALRWDNACYGLWI